MHVILYIRKRFGDMKSTVNESFVTLSLFTHRTPMSISNEKLIHSAFGWLAGNHLYKSYESWSVSLFIILRLIITVPPSHYTNSEIAWCRINKHFDHFSVEKEFLIGIIHHIYIKPNI